jgi:hypothetical protein
MTTSIYLSSLKLEVEVTDELACESMLHLNMMINKLKGDLHNAKGAIEIFQKSRKHPCRSAGLSLVADLRAVIDHSEFMLREQASNYGKRPTSKRRVISRKAPGLFQGY